jgi:lysophospholipase L1-like esterase
VGGDTTIGGSGAASGSSSVGGGGTHTGGTTAMLSATGGMQALGGTAGVGGATATGGAAATGGVAETGGRTAPGGGPSTGGAVATGGLSALGGTSAAIATGGRIGTGGAPATGGSLSTGGAPATGGTKATGGTLATGGSKATGGTTATGGSKNTGGMMSTGGSTNGGAASYKPCPTDGTPCKILPFGDSITWGYGYDGGYRIELFTRAVAAQHNITFTGSLSNGPNTVSNTTFPKRNEGHSGWTIATANSSSGSVAGITALIPSPALDAGSGGMPHIVLLHIGTNDVWTLSGQTMSTQLGTLLDKIITAAPNALIVVAKITPLTATGGNNTVNTYNNLIPGLVQTRAAAGKHVILADMNTGFATSNLASDGIHPTQAGYTWMGDQWYAVISGVLP